MSVGCDTGVVDRTRRTELAREVLSGYVSGPDAATEATARALERIDGANHLILVEGISDQIAVETTAARLDRDLEDEHTVCVPIGGIHAIPRFLSTFGPPGANLALTGLYDEAEEDVVQHALVSVGATDTRSDLGALGFHVCVRDLEDELIRAAGVAAFEQILEDQGDLVSFRTMQGQPAWRGRPVAAQLRRFLGSGARRKLRYARLLVEAVDRERIPAPLVAVLDTPPGVIGS